MTDRTGSAGSTVRTVGRRLALAGAVGALVASSLATPAYAAPAPAGVHAGGTSPSAQSAPPPIVGFADLHAHQFGNLGLGGLAVWGSPFSPDDDIAKALPLSDYAQWSVDIRGMFDLPILPTFLPLSRGDCQISAANLFLCPLVPIHGVDGSFDLLNPALGGRFGHAVGGAPSFDGWPAYNVLTAQQMYYEWLERSWRGGQRVMTMLAVNNKSLCSVVYHRASFGCDDMPAVERQIQAAKDLEAFIDNKTGGPGQGWYRIAYSSAEARQYAAQGKLAVILGVEVPALLGCTIPAAESGACNEQSVKDGVQHLYDIGVRHVFPVHNADNAFGGSALYNGMFDLNNLIYNGALFDAGACPQNSDSDPNNDVEFHLDLRDTMSSVQDWAASSLDPITKALALAAGVTVTGVPPAPAGANCNNRGLTQLGRTLITELMSHDMLIDIDHMGTWTTNDVLGMAEQAKYPGIVSGHTGIVEMGVQHAAPTSGTNRHEGNKDDAQLARIKALGGLVAVILHQGDTTKTKQYVGADGSAPVPFTCGDSSQAWAQPYLYLADKLDFDAIAIGSDFNGLAGMPAPRFGPDACNGHLPAGYVIDQNDPASGPKVASSYSPYKIPSSVMTPMQIGPRTVDFNEQGMATAGQLPDMIEDVRQQLGAGNEQLLDPLMNSAEAYVHMWERVEDQTPPDVACTGVDEVWHNDNVTVACAASDWPAGLDAASPASFQLATNVAVGVETASAQTLSKSICDTRGNCTTAGPFTLKIDRKAPALSCGPPDGLWHATNVSIACSSTDGGSGLLQSADASFSLSTTVAVEEETANAATGTRSVCDVVNNCATAGPISGNKVDRRAPTISLATPLDGGVYVIGSSHTVTYGCTDGGSGVATCSGTLANGTALPTGATGTYSFSVDATDQVANARTALASYAVTYAICPLYDSGKPLGSEGSTVPVRVRICDANGTNLSAPTIQLTATKLDGSAPPPNFSGGSNVGYLFRYDSKLKGYVYNVKTSGLSSGGHVMTFVVSGDPVPHEASFLLR